MSNRIKEFEARGVFDLRPKMRKDVMKPLEKSTGKTFLQDLVNVVSFDHLTHYTTDLGEVFYDDRVVHFQLDDGSVVSHTLMDSEIQYLRIYGVNTGLSNFDLMVEYLGLDKNKTIKFKFADVEPLDINEYAAKNESAAINFITRLVRKSTAGFGIIGASGDKVGESTIKSLKVRPGYIAEDLLKELNPYGETVAYGFTGLTDMTAVKGFRFAVRPITTRDVQPKYKVKNYTPTIVALTGPQLKIYQSHLDKGDRDSAVTYLQALAFHQF